MGVRERLTHRRKERGDITMRGWDTYTHRREERGDSRGDHAGKRDIHREGRGKRREERGESRGDDAGERQ